jgi:hypothetical protein
MDQVQGATWLRINHRGTEDTERSRQPGVLVGMSVTDWVLRWVICQDPFY